LKTDGPSSISEEHLTEIAERKNDYIYDVHGVPKSK